MIRIALCLGLALAPALAVAESLQEALVGSWAKVEGASLTDEAMVAAAGEACAQPGFGEGQGLVISEKGQALSLEIWRRGAVLTSWDFDAEVHGGRLEDGRLLLQFSVDGTPMVEMTFWRITVGETEQSLVDVLGPGSDPAIYLKCA